MQDVLGSPCRRRVPACLSCAVDVDLWVRDWRISAEYRQLASLISIVTKAGKYGIQTLRDNQSEAVAYTRVESEGKDIIGLS